MTQERLKLGRRGEDAAVEFLQEQGYKILEQNFKSMFGEIDIIAEDKETLCFVEVKTRASGELGSPFEAVSRMKQRKLSKVALSYLKAKDLFERSARFDVVAISKDENGETIIELLKDAFELSAPYAY